MHSGRTQGDSMTTRQVVADGLAVVADGLERMLREGIPDLRMYFQTTKDGD